MHHDGRRGDWTCEAPATGLVDPGHGPAALLMERLLERASCQETSHRNTAPNLMARGLPCYFDFLTSFMRAALPLRSRRKYSLARRTLADRTTSIFWTLGECIGKMRSTP